MFSVRWPIFLLFLWGVISPVEASLREAVEAEVDLFMAANHIPGLQLGLWRSGQEQFVLEKGFGNLDPSTPTDRAGTFRIASITKSFTAMRILQLVAGGEVDLDAPVSTYLPDHLFSAPLQNNSATVRQLANMTSGIRDYTASPDFIAQFLADPLGPVTDLEIVNWANTSGSPLFAPGTAWNYSNTNTILLGMIIDSVTQSNFATQIAQNLLAPAGLSQTSYPGNQLLPTPFNHGYDRDANTGIYSDVSQTFSPTFLSSAGGMISTLDDLRLWGEILSSGSLLPAAQRDWLNAERFTFVPTEGDTHEYDAYGLGVGIVDGWIGHNGDLFGYQSVVLHDPAHDQTLVITINLGGSPDNLPTLFFAEKLSPLLAIPEPSTASLLSLIAAAAFLWQRHREL
jgi:D-alanyl-D-alanine carboxypeptidase